jgi:hypothetical protein
MEWKSVNLEFCGLNESFQGQKQKIKTGSVSTFDNSQARLCLEWEISTDMRFVQVLILRYS